MRSKTLLSKRSAGTDNSLHAYSCICSCSCSCSGRCDTHRCPHTGADITVTSSNYSNVRESSTPSHIVQMSGPGAFAG